MNMETIKTCNPEPLNLARQVIAWQFCMQCGKDMPTNHRCSRRAQQDN